MMSWRLVLTVLTAAPSAPRLAIANLWMLKEEIPAAGRDVLPPGGTLTAKDGRYLHYSMP